MTASYDAVLFDLDGALTSTAALHASVECALDEGRVEAFPGSVAWVLHLRRANVRYRPRRGDATQVGPFDAPLRPPARRAAAGGLEREGDREAEDGDQARDVAALARGLGDHRVDQHHQQRAGGEAVDAAWKLPDAVSAIA